MTHKKQSVAQLCSIFYLLARSGNETTEVLSKEDAKSTVSYNEITNFKVSHSIALLTK